MKRRGGREWEKGMEEGVRARLRIRMSELLDKEVESELLDIINIRGRI